MHIFETSATGDCRQENQATQHKPYEHNTFANFESEDAGYSPAPYPNRPEPIADQPFESDREPEFFY
jgi:hypothetical protein